MRIGALLRIACLGSIAVLAGASGAAQGRVPPNSSGIVNDYSAGAGGPWHLSGEWDLRVKGASGRADFSAAIAMVRSDLWVVTTQADATDTEARMPHTHHVSVRDGSVIALPNGIRITGTASVTGSGNFAFEAPIQIDLTGGSAVAFSNIAITFDLPASNHFGTLPLNGVVSRF